MDIEKTREIIYHPLKKQELPKYVKRNFNTFALSTFDLMYYGESCEFRHYCNRLLDQIHKNYHLADRTDDNMYIDAVMLGSIIYHKLYHNSCAD